MEDRLSASGRPEVQIELAGVVVMDACASWDYDGSAWCRLRLSSNGLAAATNGYSYGTKNCQMLDTLVATDTSDRAFYKYQMVKEKFEGSGSGPIKEYGDRADLRNSGVLVIPELFKVRNDSLNVAQLKNWTNDGGNPVRYRWGARRRRPQYWLPSEELQAQAT